MNWLMRLALCAALFCAACAKEEERFSVGDAPARAVAKIVGDPAATDTKCTADRWAPGNCDYVVVNLSVYADWLQPGPMWRAGTTVGTSPQVWEKGSAPVTTRLWVYQIWQAWETACSSVPSGVCTVVMNYTAPSGSNAMYLYVTSDVTDADPPLLAAYFHDGSGGVLRAPTYAVAYDGSTGSFGVTQASRQTQNMNSLAGVPVDHDWPNLNGNFFGSDYPAWHAVE